MPYPLIKATLSLAWVLNRYKIPGGYRLIEWLRRSGALNRVARYDLGRGVTLDVPLWLHAWDKRGVLAYSTAETGNLAEQAEGLPRPLTFIDCGAAIGMVCATVIARTSRVDRLFAFEPNALPFRFLDQSLRRWPVHGEAHNAAVLDFVGDGALVSPQHDESADAMYVVSRRGGDVRVVTIDSLGIAPGGGILMKIDVEGGELEVLRGSCATLKRAAAFCVSYEAQIDQVRRTGREPNDCIRFLNGIRPCEYWAADVPGLVLDLNRPFFAQIKNPLHYAYNIFCRSL